MARTTGSGAEDASLKWNSRRESESILQTYAMQLCATWTGIYQIQARH